MRGVLTTIEAWCRDDHSVSIATVVWTSGSAPLPIESTMTKSAGGQVVGFVWGGCVEGAVYDLASDVMTSGAPRLATDRFGDDEEAVGVGATCGGSLSRPIHSGDALVGG